MKSFVTRSLFKIILQILFIYVQSHQFCTTCNYYASDYGITVKLQEKTDSLTTVLRSLRLTKQAPCPLLVAQWCLLIIQDNNSADFKKSYF